MKKILTLCKFALLFVCLLYLYGCKKTVEMYTITFDSNGGSVVGTVETDGKSEINMPDNPTREGYIFLGWYWDKDSTERFFTRNAFLENPINEDITVYAAWLINQFTISFVSNGGSYVPSIIRDYNTTIEKPNDPIRAGYTFLGWYSDEACTNPYTFTTMPAQNITLYAKWQINQTTISFEVDGGSSVSPITQDYLSQVTAPTPPTKTGYTFLGWYGDTNKTKPYTFTTMPIIDITLYAKWELNKYMITYDVDGGEEIAPSEYYYGYEVHRKEPKKTGFTFLGWYLDEEKTIRYYSGSMPAENFTLYAKWERNQYQIKYYVLSEDYQRGRFVPLFDDEKIVQISLGVDYSIALTSTGRVFTWGNNYHGYLGDDTYDGKDLPQDITQFFELEFEEKIIFVTVGYEHSAAITSNGRVFTWGYNKYNNLGDGSTINRTTPRDITSYFLLSAGEKIIHISLGENHSGALTSNGRVFMWGWNSVGQLGNRTNKESSYPIDITNYFNLNEDEEITQIALGAYHSSAVTSLGRIFMWGINDRYQLGNGSLVPRHAPTDMTENFSLDEDEKIIQVAFGDEHSAAITSKGRIFTWGANSAGQLGDGSRTVKTTPHEITNQFILNPNEKIIQISLDYSISAALTSDGRIFTWGSNNYGQLGVDTPLYCETPQDITNRIPLKDEEMIVNINLGKFHSAIITNNGRMFAWGSNNYGNLGNDSHASTNYPIQVKLFSYKVCHSVKLYYDDIIPEYIPELAGYSFSGWYKYMMFSNPNDYQKMPGNNIKLYGYWIKNND